MKVKIRKTGEIVNLASYARITLDSCDSWGNPIEMKPEEVEFISEVTEDEHWQDIREHAAIAAMQGTMTILGSSDRGAFREIVVQGYSGKEKTYPKEIAEFAVACADALIKQLKEKRL